MENRLRRETTRLKKSWMQYEKSMLQDYLVERTEDPRINVQSILTRHFLIEALFGNQFAALQEQELRFAVVMNWLFQQFEKGLSPEDAEAVLYALRKGADNATGVEIPYFLSRIFAGLPASVNGTTVPNYIASTLKEARFGSVEAGLSKRRRDTFQLLWRQLLARRRPRRISVLEPACGSANDYRFIDACGLARLLEYTGFDLCQKNVGNAKRLFPGARFRVGNAFEIDLRDKAVSFSFVHDLFEHLSIKGMETAIAEICRVTRKGICAHFFNMAETDEHAVTPVDDYHWNRLSMAATRELFLRHATAVQVIHIGTFLRWSLHCPKTYNETAYTFVVTL